MKQLFLIIKGTEEEALLAAAARGVTLLKSCPVEYNQSTYAYTLAENERQVRDWFNEDLGKPAPFKLGCLLWWALSPGEMPSELHGD